MDNTIERAKLEAMLREMEYLGIQPSEQMNLMDAVLRANGFDPETLYVTGAPDDEHQPNWQVSDWPSEEGQRLGY